jgi:long-chain fatty acid transport protein
MWDKDILPKGMNLPQQLNAGIAFHIMENLIVTGDFKWIDWDGSEGGTGASLEEGGFGWRDQYIGVLGAQWGITENLMMSMGFNHGRSAIPEESLFTNILAPTISENHLAFGIGYFVTDWMRLDSSYSHTFKNTITDNATVTSGAFASLTVDQVQVEATINF